MSTKVLIVEDHRVVAEGLERLFAPVDWIQVVGRAGTLREAEVLARRHDPHIIVLDLRLPDSQGPATVLAMQRCCPGARLVVLTAYDWHLEEAAEQLGVSAFFRKETAADDIIETIARLAAPERSSKTTASLTARELQVADLAAQGLSNSEIAHSLCVSENTVKTHLAHILRKLKLKSRVELARKWA